MFRDLDKDGNGFIDESELVTALRRLGLNPSLKEIQSMIDEVDSDGNEIIFLSLKNFNICRKYNYKLKPIFTGGRHFLACIQQNMKY